MKIETKNNETLKQEQANKMAEVFKSISIKELSEFASSILWGIGRLDEEICKNAITFVSELNFTIIAQLSEVTNQKQRIELLQKVLPEFFFNLEQDETRRFIEAAGISLMKGFGYLSSNSETIEKQMKLLTAFMQIAELYEDYYIYDKQILKELKAA